MWALVLKIWGAVKGLLGLIVPFFSGVRQFAGWSSGAKWAVRILLILLIVAGLYLLNRQVEMERGVRGPLPLGQTYLPVLFLLFLGEVWLGYYLWQLLTEEDVSDFPDIDAAWEEATAALEKAGIDLKKVSVFLILGQTAGGEDRLFEAALPSSHKQLRVGGAPRRVAPLHVYATEDAVYVTCARASVLGRQVARLLGGGAGAAPAADPGASAGILGRSMRQTIFETMQPGGGQVGKVQELLNRAHREKRALTAQEQDEMRRLMGGDQNDSFAPQARPAKPSFIRDEAEMEEHAARLHHLCRLIARSRQPDLPVRGVLVLLPWAGTETDEAATAVIEACRRDLAAAREGLQVTCPHFALVSDLETAPGFHEFLEHFDDKLRRTGRVGRSFPLAPEPRALAKLLDAGMERFCAGEFSTWVYEFFRLEMADDRETITEANVNLYQLLVQLLERRQRLTRILARGLVVEGPEPAMLGGCYLAGTGGGPGEQAFVAAVFHRLLKERENVSWTEQARVSDDRNRTWGTYGLVALGVLVAVVVAAVVYAVRK
jgi:hypothetical protein